MPDINSLHPAAERVKSACCGRSLSLQEADRVLFTAARAFVLAVQVEHGHVESGLSAQFTQWDEGQISRARCDLRASLEYRDLIARSERRSGDSLAGAIIHRAEECELRIPDEAIRNVLEMCGVDTGIRQGVAADGSVQVILQEGTRR